MMPRFLGRLVACAALVAGCQSTLPAGTWVVRDRLEHEPPQIGFHFPPPLDSYQGEVKRVRGNLAWGVEDSSSENLGCFEVAIEDVTLGVAELDESVRYNAIFLQSRVYPTSKFVIRSLQGTTNRLAPGQRTDATLAGTFELKGVAIPLEVGAVFEPRSSSSDGKSELHMWGTFVLEKLRETFQISGPGEEDEPAGNRLLLDFHLVFAPESGLRQPRGIR